jgi:hypothetical protein
MKIYKAEKDAGISDILSAQSSIVYASLLEKSDINSNTQINNQIKEIKALAGINDNDLYYTQSILVTTSWNKNDDIFDPKEVWVAKSTPTHKPTNLEHDENVIVGHITSNWPIDDEGNIIEENIDENELPEKFHILIGSVIYTGYTEPELRERSQNLIAEIESGSKYVSMECFFKGFDYGLINKSTGKYNILPRNEETAFLTKHLRAYGGVGEHQDYKIGRVLRHITFSGKGFVNKPANPESVIFTKDSLLHSKEIATIKNYIEKNDDSTKKGVFSNQANLKENNMSIEAEVTQPEEVVPMVEETVTTVAETTDTTAPEVTEVAEKEEAAKKMEEENKKMKDEMQKMKAAISAIEQELASANTVIAGYKMKEEEMAKKEKKMKRTATLVEHGVDSDLATATVEKFESLDDAAFDNMVSLIAGMKMPKKKEEPVKAEEVENTSVKADDVSSVLENVETEDTINLSVGNENSDSEIQNTRAALVDFVCIRLGKKLNKGE